MLSNDASWPASNAISHVQPIVYSLLTHQNIFDIHAIDTITGRENCSPALHVVAFEILIAGVMKGTIVKNMTP
jgi:hypothetical protein